jgi:hypothetical protein
MDGVVGHLNRISGAVPAFGAARRAWQRGSSAAGAVYDALVALAAVEHGAPLATRDLRAEMTTSSGPKSSSWPDDGANTIAFTDPAPLTALLHRRPVGADRRGSGGSA